MYLLHLDESGNEDNPADRHFVLGGAARRCGCSLERLVAAPLPIER